MTTQYLPDQKIQVGDIQARYWAEGSQGSAVILIHGLGGYVENWWPNILTLAQGHRVFAVDMPGFGRSDKPADAPYDLPYFARFIHDFMVTVGLERAHLVGHSLGGAVALLVAQTYPQTVDRLVLVAPGGLGREAAAMLRILTVPLLGEALSRPSLESSRSFIKAIIYDPALLTEEDAQYDYAMALEPGTQRAFLKTMRALGNLFGQKQAIIGPIIANLPAMTQPTLVIWGREDNVVPLKHSDVALRIPGARRQIFEKCRHVPQFEHPELFDRVVGEFLAD